MREDGRRRAVIERVTPQVDGGRFAVRRLLGEPLRVEAEVFADGDDLLSGRLLWRAAADFAWTETPLVPLGGDRWQAVMTPGEAGRWLYSVSAWVDPFQTWRRDLERQVAAGKDLHPFFQRGARLLEGAGERAREGGRYADSRVLAGLARDLGKGLDSVERLRLALDRELGELMERYADRRFETVLDRELPLVVERERAGWGAWIEPAGPVTVEDLEDAAELGFDVVSIPGAPEVDGLRRLLDAAEELNLELALEVAGLSRLDLTGDDWKAAWEALRSAVERWIREGVRIFRFADPPARPFAFWEWLIGEVQSRHPDVLFLAAAAARRERLAKLGFTQILVPVSEWREGSGLDRPPLAEFLRPSLWADSRDPLAVQRFLLAATLGANFGVSGPLAPDRADNLRELASFVNRLRREHPALERGRSLRFHGSDNPEILAYSKQEGAERVLVVVLLDPCHVRSAWIDLDLGALELAPERPFAVRDLLTGARYRWHGARNFVALDPRSTPAHLFRIEPWEEEAQ